MGSCLDKFATASSLVLTSLYSSGAEASPSQRLPSVKSADLLLVQAPLRDERGIWRGYHGIREPQSDYRRHADGWWCPLATFAAGAILGETIAGRNEPPPLRPAEALPPPPVDAIGYDPRHYDWGDRYQSYRTYDNTFQPYEGSRRQCRSPFG